MYVVGELCCMCSYGPPFSLSSIFLFILPPIFIMYFSSPPYAPLLVMYVIPLRPPPCAFPFSTFGLFGASPFTSPKYSACFLFLLGRSFTPCIVPSWFFLFPLRRNSVSMGVSVAAPSGAAPLLLPPICPTPMSRSLRQLVEGRLHELARLRRAGDQTIVGDVPAECVQIRIDLLIRELRGVVLKLDDLAREDRDAEVGPTKTSAFAEDVDRVADLVKI